MLGISGSEGQEAGVSPDSSSGVGQSFGVGGGWGEGVGKERLRDNENCGVCPGGGGGSCSLHAIWEKSRVPPISQARGGGACQAK